MNDITLEQFLTEFERLVKIRAIGAETSQIQEDYYNMRRFIINTMKAGYVAEVPDSKTILKAMS